MMRYTPDEPRANCSALISAVDWRSSCGQGASPPATGANVSSGSAKPFASKGPADSKRASGRASSAASRVAASIRRGEPLLAACDIMRAAALTTLPCRVYSARSSEPAYAQNMRPVVRPLLTRSPDACSSSAQAAHKDTARHASSSAAKPGTPPARRQRTPLSSTIVRSSATLKAAAARCTVRSASCAASAEPMSHRPAPSPPSCRKAHETTRCSAVSREDLSRSS
mmetsp:Transcript_52242/g.168377  ORF Transcript_52242/g.168377 Transcript_52242/m.168377 type:complete len:226 (+) Transcript_52242:589-1266(+)